MSLLSHFQWNITSIKDLSYDFRSYLNSTVCNSSVVDSKICSNVLFSCQSKCLIQSLSVIVIIITVLMANIYIMCNCVKLFYWLVTFNSLSKFYFSKEKSLLRRRTLSNADMLTYSNTSLTRSSKSSFQGGSLSSDISVKRKENPSRNGSIQECDKGLNPVENPATITHVDSINDSESKIFQSYTHESRPIPTRSSTDTYSNPIVLDIGSTCCRIGYSREKSPTLTLKYFDIENSHSSLFHRNNLHACTYASLISPLGLQMGMDELSISQYIKDWNALEKIWKTSLREFKQSRLQEFISKPELLSTAQASNDSSLTSMTQSNGESPILITWDPARNPNDVGKVAEILFECGMNGHSSISLAQGTSCGVPALYFGLKPVLGLYAAGKTSGISIHSGHYLTHTCAIDEGLIIPKTLITCAFGGKDIQQSLLQIYRQNTMLSISSKVRERCLNDLLNIVENPDATQQILRSDSSHGHFSEDNDSDNIIFTLPDGTKLSLRNIDANRLLSYEGFVVDDHQSLLLMFPRIAKHIQSSDFYQDNGDDEVTVASSSASSLSRSTSHTSVSHILNLTHPTPYSGLNQSNAINSNDLNLENSSSFNSFTQMKSKNCITENIMKTIELSRQTRTDSSNYDSDIIISGGNTSWFNFDRALKKSLLYHKKRQIQLHRLHSFSSTLNLFDDLHHSYDDNKPLTISQESSPLSLNQNVMSTDHECYLPERFQLYSPLTENMKPSDSDDLLTPIQYRTRAEAAWLGGSVLASLPDQAFHSHWISRAAYDEYGAEIVHMKCQTRLQR